MNQLAHSYIKNIKSYPLGKSTGELATDLGVNIDDIIRLGANENSLGMSPKVQKVMQAYLRDSAHYPEVSTFQRAIGAFHAIDPQRVIPGNGSCEILELAAQAFLRPGTDSVYPLYSFVMYKLATLYVGAKGIAVKPRADFTDDLPAMLAAITPETRIVWLSNVANPTGSFLRYEQIKSFIAKVPPHTIVLLDEAYTEYLPDSERIDTTSWTTEFPNLLITRTFSKIYGLAGLRVGYGVAAPELAEVLHRLRGPYNCNSLAITAAIAALEDQDFVERSRAFNQAGLRQLTEGLTDLGLDFIRPAGNFITINVGDATAVAQKLLAKGIVVLPLNSYELPEYIRVTVGQEAENRAVLAALQP